MLVGEEVRSVRRRPFFMDSFVDSAQTLGFYKFSWKKNHFILNFTRESAPFCVTYLLAVVFCRHRSTSCRLDQCWFCEVYFSGRRGGGSHTGLSCKLWIFFNVGFLELGSLAKESNQTHMLIRELTSARKLSHADTTKTWVAYDDSQYNLQYNFIAKCQYTDCTRNVVFGFLLACEKIEFIYIYVLYIYSHASWELPWATQVFIFMSLCGVCFIANLLPCLLILCKLSGASFCFRLSRADLLFVKCAVCTVCFSSAQIWNLYL